MHQSGALQSLSKEWQKELELQPVEDEQSTQEHAAQAIRDFMHDKSTSFKDIEQFMHILHDWIEETSTAVIN